jgi:tRNA threonylcarbamoyladenosine biosynthesis protein TsaB
VTKGAESDLVHLGIDASLDRPIVAVRVGAKLVVRTLPSDHRRSAWLLPEIRDALSDCGRSIRDIAHCTIAAGPGSFTGLRVAATVARVLVRELGCSITMPSSLAILAQAAASSGTLKAGRIEAVIDARGGRLFAASYEWSNEQLTELAAPRLMNADAWLSEYRLRELSGASSVITGQPPKALANELGSVDCSAPSEQSRAMALLDLGELEQTAGRIRAMREILPLYLRPPECEEVYEKRRAAAIAKRAQAAS